VINLRIAFKIVALVSVSMGLYLFARVTTPLLSIGRRLRGASPRTGAWRTRLFRIWARSLARVLGMQSEVRGTPPDPPFILVANHLSYVDVILLGSCLPCVFVAKADLASWPLAGSLCRAVDTLFIDRASKRDIPRVMEQIDEILQDGRGVVVFPEGTSSKGDAVAPFRSGLLEAAARSDRPVSYAALSYTTPPHAAPARLAICWWGDAPLLPHLIELMRLPRFRATVTFGEESIRETDRKILASRLHAAVQQQFQAVV
jgi:1-acyl-sn-glycerol-3-phosphate acyltransferase